MLADFNMGFSSPTAKPPNLIPGQILVCELTLDRFSVIICLVTLTSTHQKRTVIVVFYMVYIPAQRSEVQSFHLLPED